MLLAYLPQHSLGHCYSIAEHLSLNHILSQALTAGLPAGLSWVHVLETHWNQLPTLSVVTGDCFTGRSAEYENQASSRYLGKRACSNEQIQGNLWKIKKNISIESCHPQDTCPDTHLAKGLVPRTNKLISYGIQSWGTSCKFLELKEGQVARHPLLTYQTNNWSLG